MSSTCARCALSVLDCQADGLTRLRPPHNCIQALKENNCCVCARYRLARCMRLFAYAIVGLLFPCMLHVPMHEHYSCSTSGGQRGRARHSPLSMRKQPHFFLPFVFSSVPHCCAQLHRVQGDDMQGPLAARYPNGGYIIPWGRGSGESDAERQNGQMHADEQRVHVRKVKLQSMANKLGVAGPVEVRYLLLCCPSHHCSCEARCELHLSHCTL
jgi:hypothetical protein